MYFFKAIFQNSQLESVFGRHAEKIHYVFKLQNNRLNNRDFNNDKYNLDYDFFHNLAALREDINRSIRCWGD